MTRNTKTSKRATTWENHVWDHAVPASEAEIRSVEQALGIRFPEDFRQIAMIHQGQTPRPNVFTVGNDASVFNNLFIFRDEPEADSFLKVYDLDKRYAPAGVYSFATDPGGNRIGFDYRASPDAPSIVFYDTEQEGDEAITFLAASFTEFLDSLY